jgi:CheY-like chemotaxis protein
MDGLETTAAIRSSEAGRGGHIPIVAMTAHALAGDRERCLRAGMDGYISKPIRPQALFDAVEAAAAGTAVASVHPPEAGAPGVFDETQALQLADGDRQLLRQVIHLFAQQWPSRLQALRRALTRGDAVALQAAAHAVKGAAAGFAATALASSASALETMARGGRLEHAEGAAARLEGELTHLRAVLQERGYWRARAESSRSSARSRKTRASPARR